MIGFGLFEDQLGKVIKAVLPYYEVVTFARIVDEGAGDALLIAEGLELGTVVHQTISATTYHPQQLVLLLHLVNIGDELGCTHGVGG